MVKGFCVDMYSPIFWQVRGLEGKLSKLIFNMYERLVHDRPWY